MDELNGENGNEGVGAIWHLRWTDAQGLVDLDSTIIFELADSHGKILASASIPAETIVELLQPHVSILAELQLDGTVSLRSELFASAPLPKTTDILELVVQALAPEMLEDEPDALQMLSKFRDRLLKSMEHIEKAIASLPRE
jgi:hypothetical protein